MQSLSSTAIPGNEEVAAMVTKELGLPVLLWGPLDDVFEPTAAARRGLFVRRQPPDAALRRSVQLQNCRSDPIADGLTNSSALLHDQEFPRYAHCTGRSASEAPSCSAIFNEGELMQRFGMHIIPGQHGGHY